MRELDLSWVAGLIEGEGSIRIARRRGTTYVLEVSVTMCDNECIQELVSIFEGWSGIHHRQTLVKRQSYIWIVSSKRAGEVLEELLPYFRSERVQTKAQLALEFQAQKRAGAARYIEGYSGIQEGYFDQMKKLNIRGPSAGVQIT